MNRLANELLCAEFCFTDERIVRKDHLLLGVNDQHTLGQGVERSANSLGNNGIGIQVAQGSAQKNVIRDQSKAGEKQYQRQESTGEDSTTAKSGELDLDGAPALIFFEQWNNDVCWS